MKALNLIIIGLIIIGLSAFTSAVVHDEKIESVWEQIGLPDDEMSKLNVTAYANTDYIDFSNEYIIHTLSTHIAQHLDLNCMGELEEGHSAKYAYAVCTKNAVRSTYVYIDDLDGNRMLTYDPGAGEGTTVSISGNYAAVGSSNNIIHSFKLSSEGKWALAWKYTTDATPRAVHISDNVIYAGDAGNVYSINKEIGNLNWKYATGKPITQVYGTGNGVVASTSDGTYFIDESGNLIKKQNTGTASSIYVDGSNVAVGAGSNVYLFDTSGNLKFDYKTGGNVSDIKVHSSQGKVAAGAGSSVYILALDGGELKGKFDVQGTVDTVNLWGNYVSAGVIGNDSYYYLFDDSGVADIRHGDESKKTNVKIKVKSVINKGNYAVVIHTITYTENVTNDKIKFYNLGYARAKDLLGTAQGAVLDIEKGIVEEKIEFDIAEAEEHLADAENSFAENNYPETFMHARLSEEVAVGEIERLIAEAEALMEKSKEAGVRTSDAEMALTSAENSLIRKEYANALTYARNAKELLSREARSTYEEVTDFFDGVRYVPQLQASLDIPGIQEEIDTSDDLINNGEYAAAKKHTDRANDLINEGLEKYVKSLITDAEEKVGAANAIGAQIIQPEEMSEAQEKIDKAHIIFKQAQGGGDQDKLLEVLDYAADAGDAADKARTRTIAAYLMAVVLLWAILSALVIMIIKPKWPEAHYPGTEEQVYETGEESEKEKEGATAVHTKKK